ncbi:TPA: hypothetical protein U1215_002258, partial [Streptococcus suis]|nr:hypothetical protein [Streptococcus suis]
MNKQEVIRIIQREQFQVPYGPGIFVHAVFSDKAIDDFLRKLKRLSEENSSYGCQPILDVERKEAK